MTTQEIAKKLAAHCKQGQFEQAQKELYAKNAVSIEPEASMGFEKETHGLDAIIKKGEKFGEMVEAVHGVTISEPIVAGNTFAFTLDMDTTMKGQKRSNMTELCVYQVKDGKVVSEQFFM